MINGRSLKVLWDLSPAHAAEARADGQSQSDYDVRRECRRGGSAGAADGIVEREEGSAESSVVLR